MADTELKPVKDEASTLERMLSAIPEGRATAISYARELAIEDEKYEAFIRDYDNNKRGDLGQLCRTHSIPPEQFLADVVKAAYPITDEAINLSKVISRHHVARMLPKVVERGLKEGAKAEGVVDRHQTLMAEGFHLAPKGGMVINMNQVNQQAAGLSAFEEETRELTSILSGAADEDHLLEGVAETDYIEVEEVEEEKEKVPV